MDAQYYVTPILHPPTPSEQTQFNVSLRCPTDALAYYIQGVKQEPELLLGRRFRLVGARVSRGTNLDPGLKRRHCNIQRIPECGRETTSWAY